MKIQWSKSCIRVGSVSTKAGLAALRQVSPDYDIIEIRLDVLRKAGVDIETVEQALKTRKVPALLTMRTTQEGGVYPWKSRERVLIYEKLISAVDAIDLELANVKLLKSILTFARKNNVGIVLSAHSITRKLTTRKIDRLIKEFKHHRANAYKIASIARTRIDLSVLARAQMAYPRMPLAVMALGPLSEISRGVLPALGSKLVYGYVDQPVAKKQPSIKDVSAYLAALNLL